MNNELEIVNELQKIFGNEILTIIPFPKPYFKNLQEIKAIYLGCDPSNSHCTTLEHAFALESNLPIFNKFHKDHLANLNAVGLSWSDVYVQNLCQNYFLHETSKNPIWKKAAKWWIPLLIEELSIFHKNIPVLLTSSYLYNVLVINTYKKYKPQDYYRGIVKIPVPSSQNLLQRLLIPFYRNRWKVDYHLANPAWDDYKCNIIETIHQLNIQALTQR